MPTIKDVAKESGFSATTVSIVLNNAPLARHIPDATKARIRSAAEALGYHPNPFARSLRSKRSHTVGVVVFDISDPYCTQILKGIEKSLSTSAYLPLLTDSQNNRARFRKSMDVLLERQVEGLVMIANAASFKPDMLESLGGNGVPMVLIGREAEGSQVSSVVVDNVQGAYEGLRHLMELGHRRIAFLKGPKTILDSEERWSGIRALAEEAGLAIEERLVVHVPPRALGYEGGYEATAELLSRARDFSALFAFDDMTAFGAVRRLQESGISVPEDCSVLGFDDLPAAAYYNPPLSTVRQPMDALGTTSVQILKDALKMKRSRRSFEAVHVKLPLELIVRQSTAAIGAGRPHGAVQ